MKNFKVCFKWYDTNTYCTNICIAENEDAVKKYYCKKSEDVAVSPASDYEVENARRRGMPIVKL